MEAGVSIFDINDTVLTLLHTGSAELEWKRPGQLLHVSAWKDFDGQVILVLDIATAENGWSFQPVNPPWVHPHPTTKEIMDALTTMCQR